MVQTRSEYEFIQSMYFKNMQKKALETKKARATFKKFYETHECNGKDLYNITKNKRYFRDIYL